MNTSVDAPRFQPQGQDDYISKHKATVRSAFAQVLATLIQGWLIICLGLASSIPTLIIGSLHRNPVETFNLNDGQASWFGSLPSICHLVGSLATGPIQERFGRKGSMVLVNIPFSLAWLTLYFAKSFYTLYAVAITLGLCAGLSEAPLHSYVGEIAEPRFRGTLSSVSSSAHILGVFIMYLMGYVFEWRMAALISSGFSLVTLVMMTQVLYLRDVSDQKVTKNEQYLQIRFERTVLIPESPTWLIMRNRLEDAEKSLCWLRGWVESKDVKEEFQTSVKYTTERLSSSNTEPSNMKEEQGDTGDGYPNPVKGIMNKNILRPLRMVCTVVAISYAAALAGFKPYQIHVLKEFGLQDTGMLLLVVGEVAFFTGAMGNVVCLRRYGKRKLALLGYGTAATASFGLALYCTLKGSVRSSGLVWIPLILTQLHKFCIGFSVLLLPWQLLCEVFPPVGRGTVAGIVAAWAHVVNFTMVKSLLYLEAWLTLSGVFFLYSSCAFVGVMYLYFYLPETEGKTLEQIESYFTENHDRKEKYLMNRSNNIEFRSHDCQM